MPNPKIEIIRRLNDAFRSTFQGGRVVMTSGIQALPPAERLAIFSLVRTFNKFSPGNDPHGEHDFGIIEHDGESVYWKIDCYAPDMEHGSEDPSDPAQTTRVMTIMLASEY